LWNIFDGDFLCSKILAFDYLVAIFTTAVDPIMKKKQQPPVAAAGTSKSEKTVQPENNRTKQITGIVFRVENWISRKKYWFAAAIFLVSAAINTMLFQQVKDTPWQSLHKLENCDMAFFDLSAREIAGGNWLCDTVLHPYHDWHNTLAKNYFAEYPEEAAPFYGRYVNTAGISDTMASRRAWVNEMYQGKVFHQEPLYTYLLAVTYKFLGADPNWVYGWQLLLGALINALVFFYGARYFGALSGLIAAVVVMVSGPVLVFELTLLRTTLTAFLTLLLLYQFQLLLDHNSRKNQVLFGMLAGISFLNQSYLVLFFFPALVWYAWGKRREIKVAASGLGLVLAMFLLILTPLFIRNAKVGAPITSVASHGAINLFLFNSSESRPLEPNYIHFPSLVPLMHKAGGNLRLAAGACLDSFDGAEGVWKMVKTKIDGLFMWYEVPNNMSYYEYKEFSPLLMSIPAPYWLIAPLGICGLFFGFWRYRWRFVPFFFMFMASASPLFISGSLSRLRVPLVLLMSLLASFFVVEVLRNILAGAFKMVLIAIVLTCMTWYYSSHIRNKRFFVYYPSDIMSMYYIHYKNRLSALEQEKNYVGYETVTTDLMQYIPDYFWTVNSTYSAFGSNEATCCHSVATIFKMRGAVLKILNKDAECAKMLERAAILESISDRFNQKMKLK
jgi:4-amino-4-deoxy-L-arabinose transferase-like glycosyltransferase